MGVEASNTLFFKAACMSICERSPALPALCTREQAAAYLGVKPQTLAVWLTTKRYNLPVVKVGSLVRYRLTDLEAFLDSRTIGGVGDPE
jgi:excisionase family DNA binding protein